MPKNKFLHQLILFSSTWMLSIIFTYYNLTRWPRLGFKVKQTKSLLGYSLPWVNIPFCSTYRQTIKIEWEQIVGYTLTVLVCQKVNGIYILSYQTFK